MNQHDTSRHDATERDESRPIATRQDDEFVPTPIAKIEVLDTRYVDQLERENGFLREQIGIKDGQIKELGERAHETNILIQGLQNLFLALQPGRNEPKRDQTNTTMNASYQATPDLREGN